MTKDNLGDRMKGYESVPKTRLTPRVPVLIRLDGKAFHSLTRNMIKPYDTKFNQCMWSTAKFLCDEIQGCQLAYVQSDEITLLLIDYQTLYTQGWFNYEVQKMVSVVASMASAAFNNEYYFQFSHMSWAAFDARAWNLPKEEVTNCFIWRQQDATRNAIQSLGQAYFSHKELHKKSCQEIQEMLFQTHSINFNDCPVPQKRGVCVVKRSYRTPDNVKRNRWIIDENIPIFTQDRHYIEYNLTHFQHPGNPGDAYGNWPGDEDDETVFKTLEEVS